MAKKTTRVRPTSGPYSAFTPHFNNSSKKHNTLADIGNRLSLGMGASGMALGGAFVNMSSASVSWGMPEPDPEPDFRSRIIDALERDYKENSPLHRKRALKKK